MTNSVCEQVEASANKRASSRKSVLDRRHDWEFRVDLDRKLVFSNIVDTNLRPDAVLVSLAAIEDVSRNRVERAMGRKL